MPEEQPLEERAETRVRGRLSRAAEAFLLAEVECADAQRAQAAEGEIRRLARQRDDAARELLSSLTAAGVAMTRSVASGRELAAEAYLRLLDELARTEDWPASGSGWLRTVMKRILIDAFRQRKRRGEVSLADEAVDAILHDEGIRRRRALKGSESDEDDSGARTRGRRSWGEAR